MFLQQRNNQKAEWEWVCCSWLKILTQNTRNVNLLPKTKTELPLFLTIQSLFYDPTPSMPTRSLLSSFLFRIKPMNKTMTLLFSFISLLQGRTCNWPYLDFSIDRIYQPVVTCLLTNAKIILTVSVLLSFIYIICFYNQ